MVWGRFITNEYIESYTPREKWKAQMQDRGKSEGAVVFSRPFFLSKIKHYYLIMLLKNYNCREYGCGWGGGAEQVGKWSLYEKTAVFQKFSVCRESGEMLVHFCLVCSSQGKNLGSTQSCCECLLLEPIMRKSCDVFSAKHIVSLWGWGTGFPTCVLCLLAFLTNSHRA